MTTPEQLQAWREEFEKEKTLNAIQKDINGDYLIFQTEYEFEGYLRRCQETEQAIKDVKRKLDAIEECLFQKHPSSEAKLLALRELLND